jgi:hypothetical protein
MKNRPNRNLLTIANSPTQLHFISIFLYIYKQIQMVLSASSLKEESLKTKTTAKCIPPQRLWQTELAIGREEGKHGAYYDAKIGRFLQQDSMAFPNQVQGMNRMMYVEGNPVGFRDPSGNALSNSWMYAIGTYMIAKNQGLSDEQAMVWAAAAYGVGRAKDRNKNKPTLQKGLYKAERWIKNNLLSGDKISRWYNRAGNNDKYKNTKENTISNVLQSYGNSSSCKESYGSEHCYLVFVIGYGYGKNSEKNYNRSKNLFNKIPILNTPKNQFKLQEDILIGYGIFQYNNSNRCIRKDTDDVNNENSTECSDVNPKPPIPVVPSDQ